MGKNKKYSQQSSGQTANQVTGSAEFTVIKQDLWRVLILNVIYLAGVLLLYFSNLKTHYLEAWFSKIFHF